MTAKSKVKVFVALQFGERRLFALTVDNHDNFSLEPVVSEHFSPTVMDCFEEHLPPLTDEEKTWLDSCDLRGEITPTK